MNRRYSFPPFVLCLFFAWQGSREPLRLEPDKPVEREVAGGQTHTYQITLQAGQFVRVFVEPKSVDVTLMLAGPEGRQAVEINLNGAGGPESLSHEATESGDYRIQVRALGPATLTGAYRARLEVRAPATARDKQRIAAERLLAEANRLIPQGPAAAQQTIEKSLEALALWSVVEDRYWEAYTLRLLGRANGVSRRFEQAVEHYGQALAISRGLKDHDNERVALSNLGLAYRLMDRHEKAIEYYEQSLAISRETGNRAEEGRNLNALASAHRSLSRYEKAVEYYEQSLVISRELNDRTQQGIVLNNLGVTYDGLGRYEQAVEYYEQSLAIKREAKDRAGEENTLNNLGIGYWRLRRYEKAIECYEQSLAINRETKDRVGEGGTLGNLGIVYRDLGRHQQAVEYLDRALAINREVRDRSGEGITLNDLGLAYYNLSRYEQAVGFHEQALAIAREIKSRDEEPSALYNLAKAERKRGNLVRARSLIEESLGIVEAMRSEIHNQPSRASYFASVRSHQEFYIDLLMQLHQASPGKGFDRLALEAAERTRARDLLEMLTEAGADIRQGVDAALLQRERSLASQLNAKAAARMQLLSRQHKPEQAEVLKKEVSQLENEFEQAQAAIRGNSPRYAALTQPQPLGLAEIQKQLDEDTLLLEYSLGSERSFLWAVTNNSISSHELPKQDEINQAATNVYDLLTARGRSRKGETAWQKEQRIAGAEAQLPEPARRLSEMLLSPVASQLSGKRLVIVADGALQYVPFAALPKPETGDWGLGAGRKKSQPPAPSPQPLTRISQRAVVL